ncbi:MAG: hypothetical protein J5672_05905 [Verrucomicrobia bacterium]|nr:hypothetical protein [Verrucomicrobiota bacterium]
MNTEEPMAASMDSCYCKLPLTVELRIRADKSDSYNIFIANQTKSSPWHWRIASKIKRTERKDGKASKRAQVKDKG